MLIDRAQAPTPRTEALARDVARLHGQCVGCTDCRGVCQVLLDTLVVPGLVLGAGQGRQE